MESIHSNIELARAVHSGTDDNCRQRSSRKEVYRMSMRQDKKQSGQGLVEYAVILMLIAMVGVLLLRGIGTQTSSKMDPVSTALQ